MVKLKVNPELRQQNEELEQRARYYGEELRLLSRNGRWGTCSNCPTLSDYSRVPELCLNTQREDHQLTMEDFFVNWKNKSCSEERHRRKMAKLPNDFTILLAEASEPTISRLQHFLQSTIPESKIFTGFSKYTESISNYASDKKSFEPGHVFKVGVLVTAKVDNLEWVDVCIGIQQTTELNFRIIGKFSFEGGIKDDIGTTLIRAIAGLSLIDTAFLNAHIEKLNFNEFIER